MLARVGRNARTTTSRHDTQSAVQIASPPLLVAAAWPRTACKNHQLQNRGHSRALLRFVREHLDTTRIRRHHWRYSPRRDVAATAAERLERKSQTCRSNSDAYFERVLCSSSTLLIIFVADTQIFRQSRQLPGSLPPKLTKHPQLQFP